LYFEAHSTPCGPYDKLDDARFYDIITASN
jgi:hypothetical protein